MLYTLDEKTFPGSTWKAVEYRSLPKTNLNDNVFWIFEVEFCLLKIPWKYKFHANYQIYIISTSLSLHPKSGEVLGCDWKKQLYIDRI